MRRQGVTIRAEPCAYVQVYMRVHVYVRHMSVLTHLLKQSSAEIVISPTGDPGLLGVL